MTEIKALVHDWDDTVAQGFDHYKYFYVDFANHYKLSIPTEAGLKKSWGQTIPRIASDQWPDIQFNEIERMVTDYLPKRTDNREVQLFDGIKEAIVRLHQKYPLAVLSSGNHTQIMATYHKFLSATKMYHEIVVAPPNYDVKKDHPDVLKPITTIFENKGIKPHETMLVGDHPYDKLAAETKGMIFVAVTTGITSREDFLQLKVPENHILASFRDIFSVLS